MVENIFRKLRKEKGDCVSQVVEDTGVSRTTLYEIEAGNRGVQFMDNLQALAKHYGYGLEIRLVGSNDGVETVYYLQGKQA